MTTNGRHPPAPPALGTHLYDARTGSAVMELTEQMMPNLPEQYWLGIPFPIADGRLVHRFPKPADAEQVPVSLRAPKRRPLSDIYAEGQAPLEWVVQELLPMGAVTLIAGGPKIGKTTIFLSWLRAMLVGETEWCGLTITPAVCWLYTDEGPRTLARAMEKVGVPIGPDLYQHQVSIVSENSLSWEELCDHIGDEVVALQAEAAEATQGGWDPPPVPRVIIIDTFGAWADLDDIRDYGKMTKKMTPLKRLRDRTGCAVTPVHHTSKQRSDFTAENRLEAVLGSQALNGQSDHIVLMTRHPDIPEGRNLYIETRVGFESGVDINVIMGPDGYERMTEQHTAEVEARAELAEQVVLDSVQRCFTTEWCRQRDALERRPRGISVDAFRSSVRTLLETERLEDNGHPTNSPHRMYRITGGVVSTWGGDIMG